MEYLRLNIGKHPRRKDCRKVDEDFPRAKGHGQDACEVGNNSSIIN